MFEVQFLPAAWLAVQREIDQRDAQLDILRDALGRMIAAGASDEVIEALLAAVDAVDAAELTAAAALLSGPATVDAGAAVEDVDDYPEIAAPEDSDANTRREVIARLRSEGYRGAGFDALVTLYHRDLAELEWLRAEGDCRGQLIRTQYQNNYSARKLWFCTDRELRKYASEDMLRWFDQNGRLTRAKLRDNLMGRKHYSGSGYFNA